LTILYYILLAPAWIASRVGEAVRPAFVTPRVG